MERRSIVFRDKDEGALAEAYRWNCENILQLNLGVILRRIKFLEFIHLGLFLLALIS